ncbi:MAG: hypothetical protein HGA38_00980 [Candidatus Moranbacteria bacterium]|nr:hypothetical protein [Candidatus Moranbacteria bacterium]
MTKYREKAILRSCFKTFINLSRKEASKSLQPPKDLPRIQKLSHRRLDIGKPIILWTKKDPYYGNGVGFRYAIADADPKTGTPATCRIVLASNHPDLVLGKAYAATVEAVKWPDKPCWMRRYDRPSVEISYLSVFDVTPVPIYETIRIFETEAAVYTWTDGYLISEHRIPITNRRKDFRYDNRVVRTIEYSDSYGTFRRDELPPDTDMSTYGPEDFDALPELTDGQHRTLGNFFVTPRNFVLRNRKPPA